MRRGQMILALVMSRMILALVMSRIRVRISQVFLNDDPVWEETQPGVYERESVPEGAAPLRIERVPREPPDVREHGRRFSADEAGDGPGCWEPFRAWANQVRQGRSLTHDQEVQTNLDETRLPAERAEVRPNCDVCGTPLRLSLVQILPPRKRYASW